MQFSESQLLIQQTARRFAQEKLFPYAKDRDQNKEFPKNIIADLAALGFLGMLVPENYGGVDIGYIGYALAMEEIAAGDGACSTIIAVHNSVANLPILQFGNAQQKNQFLKPMAAGNLLGAFCLTEPQAGSDAANIQTQAKRKADHYVLNGVKQFITSGKDADIAIVFASTNLEAGKEGISAFIVPTDTPGYEVSGIEDKMGQHAAVTAQITLNDLKVPAQSLLGKEGEGYKIALTNLASGRIGIGAQAIGMARSALEQAIQYAKERESFGKSIFEHQAIQFRLANIATELEAARQLLLHAAQMRDADLPCIKEVAMAKLFATETALNVCSQALQVFGGYGYLRDFPIERIYRDIRVTTIYEGTSDIQRMLIAREL